MRLKQIITTNNNYDEIIKFVEENLEKTFEFYFEHISNNWQEEIENLKKQLKESFQATILY